MSATAIAKVCDYKDLDKVVRIKVEKATSNIHSLIESRTKLIVEQANKTIGIGKELLNVKDDLSHGQFRNWVKSEFEFNIRTAQKMMSVASKFKSEPSSLLQNVDVSALYVLAADSTPKSVCDEMMGRAKEGEQVTQADVKKAIKEASPAKEEPDTAPKPKANSGIRGTVECYSCGKIRPADPGKCVFCNAPADPPEIENVPDETIETDIDEGVIVAEVLAHLSKQYSILKTDFHKRSFVNHVRNWVNSHE